MKQYTADRQAQRVLQAATPMAAAILLFLIWYFLAILPDWLLWTLTVLLLLAAILMAVLREQTMRTQALQYCTILRVPFSQKTGLNFIPLHAYGGTILLSFLRREDAEEIQVFLQNTVYNRPQSVQASE